MPEWLIQAIQRQHPAARQNFSKVACAMMTACVNSPLLYWKHNAKYHQQRLQMALQHIKTLEGMKEQPKSKITIEVEE